MPRRNILPITRDMKLGGGRTITVTVDASELDGSYTVFVETNFEPDASDGGPGLRLYLNDEIVHEGRPWPGVR